MAVIHCIKSGDGTICLVVDGRHYTISASHPSYIDIRKFVDTRPLDEVGLLSLLDIPSRISHLVEGKVRVDLDQGKVWYNDTEFKDDAFCQRILRLMTEGQDVQYLVNFLNNLGQNPEFRAIMETFRFICQEGMPITPDGCFLAYKGVAQDFYDLHSHTYDNTPDGRRIDMSRDEVCANPNNSCASGLHVGSYNYAKGYGNRVVLVKVNPRDVVSVPNHECEKMRVCGYWVVRDFTPDGQTYNILQGEVYDSTGKRVSSTLYTDLIDRGQFDNDINSHWSEEEGRTYSDNLITDDISDDYWDSDEDDPWEDEDEAYCLECGELVEDCMCDEDE